MEAGCARSNLILRAVYSVSSVPGHKSLRPPTQPDLIVPSSHTYIIQLEAYSRLSFILPQTVKQTETEVSSSLFYASISPGAEDNSISIAIVRTESTSDEFS